MEKATEKETEIARLLKQVRASLVTQRILVMHEEHHSLTSVMTADIRKLTIAIEFLGESETTDPSTYL